MVKASDEIVTLDTSGGHVDYIAASLATARMLEAHPNGSCRAPSGECSWVSPARPRRPRRTVEPGNAFSPGMRTFGITWWLRLPHEDTFFAPEAAPLDALAWHYEDAFLPRYS